jgi:hypothetical protein
MDLISTLTEYIRQQMIGEIGADDNTTYIFNIHWMLCWCENDLQRVNLSERWCLQKILHSVGDKFTFNSDTAMSEISIIW